MIGVSTKVCIHLSEHFWFERHRDNIQDCNPFHPVRVILSQALNYPAAPVVSGGEETRKAEFAHHDRHVSCHLALGVCRMVVPACWFTAIAVTTQIGSNYGEGIGA